MRRTTRRPPACGTRSSNWKSYKFEIRSSKFERKTSAPDCAFLRFGFRASNLDFPNEVYVLRQPGHGAPDGHREQEEAGGAPVRAVRARAEPAPRPARTADRPDGPD